MFCVQVPTRRGDGGEEDRLRHNGHKKHCHEPRDRDPTCFRIFRDISLASFRPLSSGSVHHLIATVNE